MTEDEIAALCGSQKAQDRLVQPGIVERLRATASNNCHDAADEIERLRADLDFYKAAFRCLLDKLEDPPRIECPGAKGTGLRPTRAP